jgi:hypothetical protein
MRFLESERTRIVLIVLLAAGILTNLVAWLLRAFYSVETNSFAWHISLVVLIYLTTLPLGYWAGQKLSGSHLTTYILLGLSVGLVEAIAYEVHYFTYYLLWGVAIGHGGEVIDFYLSQRGSMTYWLSIIPTRFLRYVVGSGLVFTAGAVLADLIKSRRISISSGVWVSTIGFIGALLGFISAVIGAVSG